jgi:magnesium transporter
MSWTRAYEAGRVVAEAFPVEEISDQLAHRDRIVFADLSDEEPAAIAATLSEECQLHDLAIEDALGRPQRTKLDRYPGHIFISTYQARLHGNRLEASELAVFATRRVVILVRKSDGLDLADLRKVWDDHPELARFGTAYLLHGLLDHVVESYLTFLEALDTTAERLEEDLFSGPKGEAQVRRHSLRLRKNLLRLRKVAVPMREVVLGLIRLDREGDGPHLDPALQVYYQDVYDHVLRVADWSENLRDIIATTLETETALQGNRLNVTMKKLTGWAAVIAVPTLITSFYGQNIPFPGYGHVWGLVASVSATIAATGLVYLNFRRRDWL